MKPEVFKGREVDVVLVLRPPGGGPLLVRDGGFWMTVNCWRSTLGPDVGPIKVGELSEDWRLVSDESEASSLVKEAMSSATVEPAGPEPS